MSTSSQGYLGRIDELVRVGGSATISNVRMMQCGYEGYYVRESVEELSGYCDNEVTGSVGDTARSEARLVESG